MDMELKRLVDRAVERPQECLAIGYTGRDLLVDYYHDMDRAVATVLAEAYGLEIHDTDDMVCGFKVVDPDKTCGCPYPCVHEGL